MSAPASYSSPQIFSADPKPSAAFSALTIARATARSRFRPGRCAVTAWRPHPRRDGLDAPGDLVEVRRRGFAGRVVRSRAGPRAVLLPLQGVVGVRQLVGDRKRRQQDQRHLANLPEFVGELADLGIDVL